MFIFAAKTQRWEGFPSLWCQIQISNLILTFQILIEIATFIELWVFVFPTLFKVFGIPCCHLF